MLLKVVQSGPSLARSRAVLPKAEIHHLRSALGLFIVNTFLVAGQIVDRAEAFLPGAVGLITLEQFTMTSFMFSRTWDQYWILCSPMGGKKLGEFVCIHTSCRTGTCPPTCKQDDHT